MENKVPDRTRLAKIYPLKILLAEDQMINQKLGLKVFEKLGYKAIIAADGKVVIEKCMSEHFDIVFMDIVMPVMDGFTATKQINKKFKGKQGRPIIIALTAHSMPGEREKCLKAGMDDYMVKPLLVDKLKMLIEHWGEKILKDLTYTPDIA
jgi:CheY-like chemotaxis protein